MDEQKALQASLKEKMDEWFEEAAGGNGWPDFFCPPELSDMMVDAAMTVILSAYHTYPYMLDEGFRLE